MHFKQQNDMKKLIYNSEHGKVNKMRKRIRKTGEMPKELIEELKNISLTDKLQYEAYT